GDGGKHRFAKGRSRRCDRLSAPVAAASEKLRAEFRRGGVPIRLAAKRMGGVRRREAGYMHQSARDQPVQGGELHGGGKQGIERPGQGPDRLVKLSFRR